MKALPFTFPVTISLISLCLQSLPAQAEYRAFELVISNKVTGGPIESGHYIAEEAPQELLKHLDSFI